MSAGAFHVEDARGARSTRRMTRLVIAGLTPGAYQLAVHRADRCRRQYRFVIGDRTPHKSREAGNVVTGATVCDHDANGLV